ncbi:protein indeterminate-domain 4, chloroplastic-like [Apium graveolens]|uniref:protein indeterminate-domain 4, chloroplastic-like n=1 Tax=Apium graveolens TaxID=4045 RepID=UPI003D7BCB0D
MNMEGSNSSNSMFFGARGEDQSQMTQQQHSTMFTSSTSTAPTAAAAQKKKRNLPGTPNPDAEVIALSPKSLMATNRFICEVCNKGFQREQNLQLHRRGHNLPWKLKKKTTNEVIKRKVYLCPEPTCIHHDASRALGDLTGIKKHYSRKHGEKKYKCDKCSKRYAVQSDWKAHSKTCGTREYRCDCGTLFSRRDSFITHRAFCDALAQESERHPSSISSQIFGNNPMHLNLSQAQNRSNNMLRLGSGSSSGAKLEQLSNPSLLYATQPPQSPFFMPPPDSNQEFQELQNKSFHGLMQLPDHLQTNTSNSPSAASNLFNLGFYSSSNTTNSISNSTDNNSSFLIQDHQYGNEGNASIFSGNNSIYNTTHDHQSQAVGPMSATALLQKAAQMGSTTSNTNATLLRGLGSSIRTSSLTTDANKFGRNSFNTNANTECGNQQLEGLTNPFANENQDSIYASPGDDHHRQQNTNFAGFGGSAMRSEHQHQQNLGNADDGAGKIHQNYSRNMRGSTDDRLTLDFLGIGGGRARHSSGGFPQREQQAGEMASLEHSKISSLSQVRHAFGNPKLL